jgi:hypothetical protein
MELRADKARAGELEVKISIKVFGSEERDLQETGGAFEIRPEE